MRGRALTREDAWWKVWSDTIKATSQGEWNPVCLPLTRKVGTSGGERERLKGGEGSADLQGSQPYHSFRIPSFQPGCSPSPHSAVSFCGSWDIDFIAPGLRGPYSLKSQKGENIFVENSGEGPGSALICWDWVTCLSMNQSQCRMEGAGVSLISLAWTIAPSSRLW